MTPGQHEEAGVRPPDVIEDPRLDALVADLQSRLRRVCGTWDAETFATFVVVLARRKLRWADEHGDGFPSGTPNRIHAPYDRRTSEPPRV